LVKLNKPVTDETVAIIDLGTNTFHLLIVEISERDEFMVKEKFKEPVKLGESGITTGKIAEVAFERGIAALINFKKLIDSRKATRILAFATSAVRSASNGAVFISEAKKKTGIDIRTINGNEEASLIFTGVKNGVQLPYNEPVLLVDIGGGSVEFIVTKENKPVLLRSLNIGAARLMETFKYSDPITKEELNTATQFLKLEMKGLIQELQEFNIKKIIGSSGTFETLGTIIAYQKKDILSLEHMNGYRFTKESFLGVFEKLQATDREGRLKMAGMDPMRADLIVMGSVVVNILCSELTVETFILSSFALKEGILYDYIEEKKNRVQNLVGVIDRNVRFRAVRNFGKKFHYDQDHGLQVAELALSIFDQLQSIHGYDEEEKELLKYGSMLHDIGHFLNRSGHHKHGQYMVMNSGLSGFSTDELLVIGNIVRYHRKSPPTRDHLHFSIMHQNVRLMVRRLAGILRIADNLDRGHRHLVKQVKLEILPNIIWMRVKAADKIDIEIRAVHENKELFEQVFEKQLEIEQV